MLNRCYHTQKVEITYALMSPVPGQFGDSGLYDAVRNLSFNLYNKLNKF